MHLVDTFIQSDLQYIQAIHFLYVHNTVYSAAILAMPLAAILGIIWLNREILKY